MSRVEQHSVSFPGEHPGDMEISSYHQRRLWEKPSAFVPSGCGGGVSLTRMFAFWSVLLRSPSSPVHSGTPSWHPKLTKSFQEHHCLPANAFLGERLLGSQGGPRGNAAHI